MIPLTKEDVDFEVQAALAWHDDDARATIATLLEDIRHLRMQLLLTEGAMSRGMTRGWTPTLERK
ncbi:dehydrogenase [Rhizobium yanglingense]|nr:dehydrogenase [Rhizobium yanglingense]